MKSARRVLFFLTVAMPVAVLSSVAVFAAEKPAVTKVSFQNDVMAVLSKAGCNRGVCHGNKFGKGGFKLSLRGFDPNFDFEAITRDVSGRRANPLEPDCSLMLLKSTMQVAHEGGRRFPIDSPEYRILRNWILAGLPKDDRQVPHVETFIVSPLQKVLIDPEREVSLHAEAVFSDGSRRDVTRLVVYEPANEIDEHIFAKLQMLRMSPSPVVNDSVFLRRAFLDLLGMLPTADEARRFVADESPEKRTRLIDQLLERPEFAEYWTLKWSDLLRNEEKTLDRKGVQAYYNWIRHSIAHNKPLNQFAQELIASRGSTYQHPESNYYRAMRDPLIRAETTAQLFLGIRLQRA